MKPLSIKIIVILSCSIVLSCSNYKQVACPDFKKNPNYNLYATNYKHYTRQKQHSKNATVRLIHFKKKRENKQKSDSYNNWKIAYNTNIENINSNSNAILLNQFIKTIENKENSTKIICKADIDENNKILKSQKSNINEVKQYAQVDRKNNNTRIKPNSDKESSYGLSIASLVLGILAFMLPFGLGLVSGILAIVFGAIGLKRIRTGGKGRGMAISGLILGIVAVVLIIL